MKNLHLKVYVFIFLIFGFFVGSVFGVSFKKVQPVETDPKLEIKINDSIKLRPVLPEVSTGDDVSVSEDPVISNFVTIPDQDEKQEELPSSEFTGGGASELIINKVPDIIIDEQETKDEEIVHDGEEERSTDGKEDESTNQLPSSEFSGNGASEMTIQKDDVNEEEIVETIVEKPAEYANEDKSKGDVEELNIKEELQVEGLLKPAIVDEILEKNETIKIELKNEAELDLQKDSIIENITIDSSKNDIGAELFVCNIGPSCAGDVGLTHWMKEANVNPDDTRRGLSWTVDSENVDSGLLEISYTSFVGGSGNKIVYSKNVGLGDSIFDFAVLFVTEETLEPIVTIPKNVIGVSGEKELVLKKSLWQSIFDSIKRFFGVVFNWIKSVFIDTNKVELTQQLNIVQNIKLTHDTYYLRVIPMNDGKVIGKATNEVKVTLVQHQEEFELYIPAKIYEVKIKEFLPIRSPSPGVCTNAMILENDRTRPKLGGGIEIIKAGERVCPDPYKGIGEEAWYESLWNAAKSGANWVSQAYNDLKSSVVDAVGSIACGGNEECVMAISAGLDIGLAAMGIPPTIPNFDELLDGGFDYLASEIASQAGCPDVACKELIKSKLRETLDQTKNTNPNCVGEEEAHNMGVEPLCLPPNVKAHLDPEATYRNASVVLEIKRNYLEGSTKGIMGVPFRVHLNNVAYNANRIGSKIVNIPPFGKTLDITQPLVDKLFESKTIIIPDLEKGESIDIPISLIAEEYWVPGHLDLMEGWTTVTYKDGWPIYQYDDWWKLYYGANLTLQASIDACENSYGQSLCIIGKDTKNYILPNTTNP